MAGGEYGDIDPETSVNAVLEIINKADKSMNGKFFNVKVAGFESAEPASRYDGAEVEW